MTVIAIEKYNIKGFPAPRPIMSEAQNEHNTEVLYSLERRGHLASVGIGKHRFRSFEWQKGIEQAAHRKAQPAIRCIASTVLFRPASAKP